MQTRHIPVAGIRQHCLADAASKVWTAVIYLIAQGTWYPTSLRVLESSSVVARNDDEKP